MNQVFRRTLLPEPCSAEPPEGVRARLRVFQFREKRVQREPRDIR
jgi:hypothetical protein